MPHLEFPWILEHPAGISDAQWLLLLTIGFVLVLYVLIKLIIPGMIRPHLVERQRAIVDARNQVESTLSETQQMRDDYRQRLERIEDETERRIAEAVRESEILREQILVEARRNAAQIVRRGEDEVSRERAKALVQVRTQFVQGVIDAAQHAAAESMDSARQSRLLDDFTKSVGAAS